MVQRKRDAVKLFGHKVEAKFVQLWILCVIKMFWFFLLAAIGNEMKRVQIKIQEEKEKEKKIYAKMFAWTISCVVLKWSILNVNTVR